MAHITDPEEIKRFLSQTEEVDYSTPLQSEQQQQPQQTSVQEDGSILTTAGKHLERMKTAYLASSVSPEYSNYMNARMERSSRELKEEQAKLGMIGNIAAGAVSALPAIGLGIVNPYAGGAAAMAMGTGEALARQYEETGEFDKGKAYLGGAAMGAIDAATGRLANVARAGLAGRAAAGGLPVAAPLAQRAAVNVAEDVSSGVGGEAMINLASGKDWDEGLPDTVLSSVVGSGMIRGSLAGLNKATNTPLNEWGKGSIESVQNLFKRDLTPNSSYTDEAIAYNNQQKDLQDKIQNGTDPLARERDIDASVNMASQRGGQAADLMMMKMIDEYGLTVTDGAFDVNFTQGLSRGGPEYNLGRSLGLSDKEMQLSARHTENVQPVRFGRDKLATQKLTKESDQKDFQETYKKIDGIMRGTFNTNVSNVGRWMKEAEFSPNVTASEMRDLSRLQTLLRGLDRDMQSYMGNKKTDTSIDIENNAREAIRLANELGVTNKLVGVDGKAGSWDPITGIMAIDRLERVARQRMPNVHQGVPSIGKDQAGKGTGGLGTAMDVAGLVTGNIWAPAARHAGKSILARNSVRNLRKAKETGTSRVKEILGATAPKSRAEAGLQAGDISAAAKGAEADLLETGLTPPVAEPEVVSVQQTTPEAPTATVEPTVAKTAPVPARAPKARQEPVQEPTPAPAPQPEKMARKPRTIKKASELAEAKAAKDKVDEMDGGIVEPITNKVEVQDVTPTKSRTLSPDKIERVEKKKKEAPKKLTPNKIPRTIKKAEALEESLASKSSEADSAPATDKFEINDVTPKKVVDSKDGMAPKIKKQEVAPVVEEAPAKKAVDPNDSMAPKIKKAEPETEPETSAPDSTIMAKRLKKDEPEAEPAKTEEAESDVKKAEEVETKPAEPEKPKVSSTELVTNPLKKEADKFDKLSYSEKNNMDPEELRKLRRAKEDLQEVESLSDTLSSQFKTSPENIMGYIHEMGGMDGIRKANAAAGHKPNNVRQFLANRIRELEDLKKFEVKDKLDALKDQVKKEVAPIKDDSSIETSKLANKHGTARSRLEAAGYDKDIVDEALKRGGASDTSKDFDPTTVNTWARRLSKEKAAKAKAKADKAAKKAKEKAAKAKAKKDALAKQKEELDRQKAKEIKAAEEKAEKEEWARMQEIAAEAWGVQQRMIESIKDANKRALAAKTAADKQAAIKAKAEAQAQLDKAKGLEREKAAALKAKSQKALAEHKAKIEEGTAEKWAAAQKEAADAWEAAKKEASDAETLRKEAEAVDKEAKATKAKADSQQALQGQITELSDSLVESGIPDHIVQRVMNDNFIYLNEALTPRQLNRTRAKVIRESEKLMNAEVGTAKTKIKPEIKKMSDGELIAAREEVMSSTVENISEPQNQAIVQSISEELQGRGLRSEQRIMSTFNDVVTKAEHMKRLYPDNPEWWIPADSVDAIQKSFGRDSTSHAGPLLRRLREKFYGISEGTEKFYRRSQKRINDEIEGKETTGLGDITVKSKTTQSEPKVETPKAKKPKVEAPAEAPVTKAHKRVEAIAEKVKAETPVVHQVAPKGIPNVAPMVSLEGDKVSIETPKKQGVLEPTAKAPEKPVEQSEPRDGDELLTYQDRAMIDAMAARLEQRKASRKTADTPLKQVGIGPALAKKDISDLTPEDYLRIEDSVNNPDNGLDTKEMENLMKSDEISTVGELFEKLISTRDSKAKPQAEKPKGVLDQDIQVKKPAKKETPEKESKKKGKEEKQSVTLKTIQDKAVSDLNKEERTVLDAALKHFDAEEAKQLLGMKGMPVKTLITLLSK